MHLLRSDIRAILDKMNKFPEHDSFEVDIDTSSGIGYTITLSMNIIHNQCGGKFTVPVIGVENW